MKLKFYDLIVWMFSKHAWHTVSAGPQNIWHPTNDELLEELYSYMSYKPTKDCDLQKKDYKMMVPLNYWVTEFPLLWEETIHRFLSCFECAVFHGCCLCLDLKEPTRSRRWTSGWMKARTSPSWKSDPPPPSTFYRSSGWWEPILKT